MSQNIFKQKFPPAYLLIALAMVVLSMFSMKLVFLIFIIVAAVIFFLIIFREITYKFITKGAPYVPTGGDRINTIIRYAKKYNCKHAVDLGSGTGDICIALAKEGINSDGVEINPFLVFISKIRAFLTGQSKTAKFELKNLWDVNVSKYDCVVVYGIGYIMKDLGERILNEITKDTIVISHRFPFPNLNELDKKGKIFVYKLSPKDK